MNSLKKSVLGFLLIATGLLLLGCASTTPQGTTIPWSRPASWENQIPGMSMPGGGR